MAYTSLRSHIIDFTGLLVVVVKKRNYELSNDVTFAQLPPCSVNCQVKDSNTVGIVCDWSKKAAFRILNKQLHTYFFPPVLYWLYCHWLILIKLIWNFCTHLESIRTPFQESCIVDANWIACPHQHAMQNLRDNVESKTTLAVTNRHPGTL